MRFASLASGSKGNCLVAEARGTRVLLDCGLSPAETRRRLARLGLAPSDVAAIVLTHEHDDHVGGAAAFAAAHGLPLYLTHGTLSAMRESGRALEGVDARIVRAGDAIAVDGLLLQPFTVPHDAREPVQYVMTDGAWRLGVVSDLGAPTPHVTQMLSGCDALVLECNHDAELLRQGSYPAWLKSRIAGPFGHLENDASAQLLDALDRTRLRHVIAAHLSEQNNRPELARRALARVLGCAEEWVGVATQSDGFGWRELK